ncbi:MFS transporter [Aspergillus terreus]|uniref:MFS transporter n=1 Tax=Aspergillus terreus TaxID=33178 RepID=A0A5M3YVF4_ASPTE|nr:hypothetical protein ATETN484_0004080200 [Aspergillus terreus]GFF13870.1 MFS transporter [Aspergillus terreus]
MEKSTEDCTPVEEAKVPSDPPDNAAVARIYRKIDRRILPFVAVIYLLCYLDRSNIGNAKVLNEDTSDDLMDSIQMTDSQYRVALMLFLVAYSIFEAPSNMALKILSPPVWLAILTASFGSVCAAIGGAHNIQTLMALRFLLGACEAGVFPGMIFYLSFCATLAGAFGGAIAYGVGHMNRVGGLQAWRWLFIIEGLPCLLLAVAIVLFLPSYPEKAKWLSTEEKRILQDSFSANTPRGDDKLNWHDAKTTLKEPRLWMHYIIYLCAGIGVSSLSLFSPSIVAGIGYTGLEAQLFVIPPYACAYVVTLAAAYMSDKYNCRGLVAAFFFLLGMIAFLIPACVSTPSLKLRYAMLVLSACGVFGSLPSLCAWVSDNVRNTTAASLASGLNVAFSGPGQIIGVWIYKDQQVPRYQLGHGDSFLYGLFVPVTPTALTDRAGLGSEDVQVWNSTIVAVQAATTSVMCPIVGYLADKTSSRRRPLLCGLALSATGTALLCVGNKLALWLMGRMLQGAGTAFVNTIGVVLLVDTVGSVCLGQYLGYLSFGLAGGMPTGPLLGGVLYEKAGYYSVFIIAFVLIGMDAIVCAIMIETRHDGRDEETDHEVKAGLPTQDCCEMIGPNGEHSGKCRSVHTNTVLSDMDQARRDVRRPATLYLITSPRIVICMWNYCLTAILSTAFDAVLPIFVHDMFHWSQMGSGLVFLTLTLPLFFDPVTGIMCDRWPRSMRYISSASLIASVPVLVSLRFVEHNTIEHKVLFCVLLSLVGFISSFVQIPAVLEVDRAVKEKEEDAPGLFGRRGAVAQAYGLCTGSYALGSIVGPLFAGFIREYAGWKTMAWSLAIVSGVSALPTFLLLGGWIYEK